MNVLFLCTANSCRSILAEACPLDLGPVVRAHWGVDDPAQATGSDDEIAAAFAAAYGILRARITAFLALPLDQLANDRSRLKNELDRIGSIDGAAS